MLIPLADKLWVVAPEARPVYPYGNCIYIDDKRSAVIDLGAGAKAFAAIPCADIDLALMSHSHFDHIHGNVLFKNAELWAGPEESQTYSDEKFYINFHGYNHWDALMPGISREAYGNVVPLPDDVITRPGFRPIELAGIFHDLYKFNLGKYEVTCIHLPGHTIGHYGFYIEKENILFTADIDLAVTGPWYSNATADVGDLIKSVRRVKEINPRILVPSHRRIQTENIQGSLDHYIQVVMDRESKILDLLGEPQSLDTLAQHGLVFPDRRNTYELFWEKMTLRHHIEHLLEQQLITELSDGVYRIK